MAAMTGQERGLPPGSYLNDTVDEGPDVAQVSVVWHPFEDEVSEPCRFTFTLANVPSKQRWSDGARASSVGFLLHCMILATPTCLFLALASLRRCTPARSLTFCDVYLFFSKRKKRC